MDIPIHDPTARSRPVPPPGMPPGAPPNAQDAALRKAAEAMEASFLAEMLKSAGVGAPRTSFGGGIGEDQFASFLTEAHAAAIVDRGGIGLAETLFNALKERSNADR